jgi:hypothetical protein
MAKVMFAGGFADEAPPLLAKALEAAALALSLTRGEDAAALGSEGAIRRLVEKAALPPEALVVLQATSALDAPAAAVEPLIAAMARILASVSRNEPDLARRQGA